MKRCLLLFILAFCFKLCAQEKLNCLILLNSLDTENIGNGHTPMSYLMCKLQSAIGEQATPILVHGSLWNSFIEKRISFEQRANIADTKENKILTTYKKIQEKIKQLTDQYNSSSNNFNQNKSLIAQKINSEFYTKASLERTFPEYQLLLNYITPFDPRDWSIYRKNGFYLLLPKEYIAEYTYGFKLDNLEKVNNPQDVSSNYLESQSPYPFVNALFDFFLIYEDFPNQIMPYSWNIVFSGHGGCLYKETNNNKIVKWIGEPCIADLNVQDFKNVLEFFQSKLNTHLFHYSSCSAGGNHIDLAFKNASDKIYNFAIICDCLTDCASYSKWKTMLPSTEKKFLTANDLYYESLEKTWKLTTKSTYEWYKFFSAISKIDFIGDQVIESNEHLPKILSYITYSAICNTSLLRRPGSNNFYPITSADTLKIDDLFIREAKEKTIEENIVLQGLRVLLLESDYINSVLKLDAAPSIRFISIIPGNAMHYIKKIVSEDHLDLPKAFWQAEYQEYNKTFLIDQCIFPHSKTSSIYQDIPVSAKIELKNVIIFQQNHFFGHFIRLFFTINDIAMMVVSTKADELDEQTILKEIIRLTPEAKTKYEEHYLKLKALLDQTKDKYES